MRLALMENPSGASSHKGSRKRSWERMAFHPLVVYIGLKEKRDETEEEAEKKRFHKYY